jgi:hypothetical protein
MSMIQRKRERYARGTEKVEKRREQLEIERVFVVTRSIQSDILDYNDEEERQKGV